MTKADLLAAALDDFLAVSPDVEAAAVVSADGLPMASALPPYVEEDRLAAMSAALLTLGERAAAGLGKGELAQVFVEGAQGYVVLMAAGRHAVLVAVTSKETKVGLVLYEMRKTSGRVAEVMDEVPAPAAAAPVPVEPSPAPAAPTPAEQAVTWAREEAVQEAPTVVAEEAAWTTPAPAPAEEPAETQYAAPAYPATPEPPAPEPEETETYAQESYTVPEPQAPVAEEEQPETQETPESPSRVSGWH